MSTAFLSPEALNYVLQAVLTGGGARESFVLYHDGGATVQLRPGGARRLSGDWSAGLEQWLPLSGDPLPLLHGGQTVGLLWTAPGEVLAPAAIGALAVLLARVGAASDPWSADQLSGQSALLDRCGRLRAATPGWLALFGLSGEAVGRFLGDLRAEWRPVQEALPGVLAGQAFTVPVWSAGPDGEASGPFGGDLRPWPLAGTELAVLFSVWATDPTSRVPSQPGAASGPVPDHRVFRAMFDEAAQAQWLVDGRGTVLEVNAAAAALEAGGGAAAMLGEPLWSAGVWRGQEGVRRQVRAAALRAGRGEAAEALLELEAGPPWQLRTRPLDGGHAVCELTPLSHAPQDLERRLALLDTLLTYSCEGVVMADAQGRVVLLNRAVRKMMTPGAQHVAARDWARHLELRGANGGETLSTAQRPLTRALRGEPVRDEEVTVTSDQVSRPALVNTYLLPGGLGAVALMQDLSEKRRLLSYLSQVTRRDPLTELPNRQAFMDRIETALEERRHDPECRYAVLVCDLGHLTDLGDQVSPTLSHRLWLDCAARFRDVFRSSDLVARFEQGQFAALLARPGGPVGLDRILDRLRESFSVPFAVGEEVFVPELRVGLVPDLNTQSSAQTVLLGAAQALRPLPVRVTAGE